jgi:hypothetical protein
MIIDDTWSQNLSELIIQTTDMKYSFVACNEALIGILGIANPYTSASFLPWLGW